MTKKIPEKNNATTTPVKRVRKQPDVSVAKKNAKSTVKESATKKPTAKKTSKPIDVSPVIQDKATASVTSRKSADQTDTGPAKGIVTAPADRSTGSENKAATTTPSTPIEKTQTSAVQSVPETSKSHEQQADQPSALSPSPVKQPDTISPPPVSEPAEEQPEQQQQTEADAQHAVEHYTPPGPQHSAKFIIQITPELAPLAKVGGLADVVNGLSRELAIRGNDVEIILPKYDNMRYDQIWGLCVTYEDLWVPWYDGHVHCTVWFGFVHGRKCFFIEPHSADNFFNRGSIYGFDDDVLRFAFFSRAALEFMLKADKHPDIIHCHDWQTALVPVFLYEIYQHIGMTKPRVCFTIHNFKHQGITGDFILNATGLQRSDYYFHHDRLLDNHIPHALNLMKGGVVYSNFITTVSPRYAVETKDGGQGFGLEPTLHHHHYKYGGVVNGIDYDTWNPEIDTHIPVQYNVDTIDGKYANKHALRQRLLLAENEKPIIAFIGRLDPQKGLDLVRHALFYALNNRAQFVLLGSSPDPDINNYFWELKRHLNDSPDCHIEIGFDEELAHLIYAGSDMMIVPSQFEPCGLTQLIAMKYGTIPVVRSVGGLADTVFDKDHAHDKPLNERNGYVFNDYDIPGIESALSRAISCYYQYPGHFRDLIANAMRSDYSWRLPGQHYLNIYDYIAYN